MTDVGWWLLLIIATEASTEILVAAKITDWLRERIFKLATPPIPSTHQIGQGLPRSYAIWRFLNDILKCGYCTSVWVAMFFALFAPILFSNLFVNWVVNFIVIHRLSNWLHVSYSLVSKGRVKTHDLDVTLKVFHNGSIRQGDSEEC